MSTCAQGVMQRQQTGSARKPAGSALQRSAVRSGCQCEECAKKKGLLQRAAVHEYAPEQVPDIVYDVLRSPGQPLDRGVRQFMEERFDHDFSAVRIHTDARAAESARAVNARAYTVGRDIAFSTGLYSPERLEGRRLLAHELAHVVQQGHSSPAEKLVIDVDGTRSAERGAEIAANSIELSTVPVPLTLPSISGRRLLREAAHGLGPTVREARAGGGRHLRSVKPSSPPLRNAPVRALARIPMRQVESEIARKSAVRVGSRAWGLFWRVVAKRYSVTLAVAAALAAADGPLPIGELIDLGLAAWVAWDIAQNWDDIWEQVPEIMEVNDEASAPNIASAIEESLANKKSRRDECFSIKENFGAGECLAELSSPINSLNEAKNEYRLVESGILSSDKIQIESLKNIGRIEKGEIRDCGLSPAIEFIANVFNERSNKFVPIAMFGCVCCGDEGSSINWPSKPHGKGSGKVGKSRGDNVRAKNNKQKSKRIDKDKRQKRIERDYD